MIYVLGQLRFCDARVTMIRLVVLEASRATTCNVKRFVVLAIKPLYCHPTTIISLCQELNK